LTRVEGFLNYYRFPLPFLRSRLPCQILNVLHWPEALSAPLEKRPFFSSSAILDASS